MTMTYHKPDTQIITAIRTVENTGKGRFLPGDGFDKNDAIPLDHYLFRLGFDIHDYEEQGKGQRKSVTLTNGVKVSRNGYCCKVDV
jgi:hypothetical protein